MKIVVDFDNTICNFSDEFEKRWHKFYDESIKFDGSMTCPAESVADFFHNFYTDVLPYDNVIEALHKLNEKHEVLICTHSESKDVTLQKQTWVKKWLGDKWIDNLLSLEGHTCDKSDIFSNYDIIIEDNPLIKGDNVVYYPQPYNYKSKGLIPNFCWSKVNQIIYYDKWQFLKKHNIKAYCICIEDRMDRVETVSMEFDRVGLDVIFDIQPKTRSLSGREGIWSAHLNKMDPDATVLIFEDDVKFTSNWENDIRYVEEFMDKNIDWDILKLGGAIICVRDEISKHIWNSEVDLLHAYFVNMNGCKKMLRDPTAYTWYPNHIDDYITDMKDIIKMCVYPNICIQRNDVKPSSNLWATGNGMNINQIIIQTSWYEWWQINSNIWAMCTRFLPETIQRYIHPYCLLLPIRLLYSLKCIIK